MKTSRFNRILSALLAIILFLGCVPVFPVLAQEKETFRVTLDGEDLTTLGLYPYEKLKIQAAGLENGENYQWQILHPERENVWVNIYDAKTDSLNVTLALVKNMLTEAGTTQLRCRANAEGQQQFTTPITVTMLEEQPALIAEPEETIPMETTVPTEPAVEETSAPTEPIETTASTEPVETAPVETTVSTEPVETTPVETTVSTEPVETVPVETTVATEPVEMVPVETTVVTEPMETISVEATDPTETFAAQISETVEPAPMLFAAFSARNAALPLAEGDAETEETTAPAETPEFVTVKIEYIRYDFKRDENGKLVENENATGENDRFFLEENGLAFSPYIATLRYGSSLLNTVVDNPTMVGYQAYYNNAKAASVTLNYDKIEQDITLKVEYRPDKVKFAVRYYFQNVYDDLYIEDSTIRAPFSGEDYTGATPVMTVLSPEIDGFTALYYQPDFIAADGSTEFAVYYERNYYLMEFDCAGGYGAETLYVRYGTYISVANPVRSGYMFGGWDLVKEEDPSDKTYTLNDRQKDNLPETMPAYNSGYKAIWNKRNANYTIVYWCADVAVEGKATTYSYMGSKTVASQSGTELTPSVVGKENPADASVYTDYAYFTYDEAATKAKNTKDNVPDAKVIVEGDGSAVVNVYYSRKEYTIRFIYAEHRTNDGNKYWLANSTGCGQYNNVYNNTNHTHHNVEWGNYGISDLPSITMDYYKDSSRQGTIVEKYDWNGWVTCTFYYIALTAEYGANIESIWPSNAIGAIGNYEFGSWGAECASEYRKYNAEHANIVGPYPTMSKEMIIDPTNPIAQTMVAWWGKASDNVSKHAYHIYYEALDPTEEGVVQYNGRYYKLDRTEVFTAAHNGSTRVDPFMYNGYTIIESQKKGYSNSKGTTTDGKDEFFHENCNIDSTADAHDWCNNFYYNRNIRKLYYYNYNKNLQDGRGADVPYGKSLARYGEEVTKEIMQTQYYPSGIEPNAYEFRDWYTTSNFVEGTEVKWDKMTMPDMDLTVYAKWTPVVHNVYFYYLYDDIAKQEYWYHTKEDGTKEPASYPIRAEHGELLGTAYNYQPERQGYDFIGWFYMDEDGKKRFAPDSMEITRDLHLFAEWQSAIDTTYEVTYVLDTDVTLENGNILPKDTPVADPTAGHTTAGKTKSFNAKGKTDLYETFRKGYFPTKSSQSILMDEDSTKNTRKFTYVADDIVFYKIRYVDLSSRTEIADSDTASSTDAIVTKKFKPIGGYIPQNFYLTRALVSDGNNSESDPVKEENVITFYYVKDTEHGMYSEEHYWENLDSDDASNPDNYTKYESIVGSKDIYLADGMTQNTHTATVRNYDGFQRYFDKDGKTIDTVEYYVKTDGSDELEPVKVEHAEDLSGPITYAGLTIKIYYERIPYPFVIEYREYGATEEAGLLWSSAQYDADGKPKYEHINFGTETTPHRAPLEYVTKDGKRYTYYDPDATEAERTKSMTIRKATEESPNKLVFYYTPKQVQVNYEAVCTVAGIKDFGGLSIFNELAASAAGLGGCTPTAANGFEFVGWYTDEACTNKVLDNWVIDKNNDGKPTHLKPLELNTTENSVTYYALFKPLLTSLKITKSATDAPTGSQDSFLFRITGKANTSTKDVNMIVAINGSGSVIVENLNCGEYTVTELTDWSWKYNCSATAVTKKIVALTEGGGFPEDNTFIFTNTYNNPDWLGGESGKENQFS